MTIYTADSGALVFATGSIQWSWGLDDYNAPGWHTLRVSEAAQRMTRTVLGPHAAGSRGAAAPPDGRPSTIVVIAALIAAAIVLRAWLTARPPRLTL